MNMINIEGLNINYKQTGQGKDIVLLHGWGQKIEAMEPLGNQLENDFRVTIIDFPGFGLSCEPKEAWSVYDYTDMLEKFIEKLNIKNPILVGHSFGGRISIIYASRHQDVNKVILMGSAGIKPQRGIDYYVRVYTYKFIKKVVKLPIINKYEDQIKSKFGSTDYKNSSGVMRATMVKVVNEDLQHLMPMIKAPTLLVWGSLDEATPLKDGQKMEKLIPDAGLVVFEGATHYAYLERLPHLMRVLNKFLENDKERN